MAFQRPLIGGKIFRFKALKNGPSELCVPNYASPMANQENREAARSQRTSTVA